MTITSEKIIDWLKRNKKEPCSNCKSTDFSLSDRFGLFPQSTFDAPATLPSQPNEFQKLIVVVCKKCGKTELFDAYIAGFVERIR